MKILRIIASVDPAGGGPVQGLRSSAAVLAARGHETEVVTLDAPGAAFLAGFPFPVHPLGPGLGRYRYAPRLERWIAANAHRFDVAVIHGLWNHGSVGGWRGARAGGLPYAVFAHGMMDPWFARHRPLKHLAKQLFWWLWQGRALRDAGAVLFTCEEERRLARGAFRGYAYRERVVAYGTTDPEAADPAHEAAFRRAVPGLGARAFVLFLSRIHPKKGCDMLVQAFARVADAYPEIDLVVAGPDEVGQRAELERLARAAGIAQRVHWPGMLAGEAKAGALSAAQAMILPSHSENFGIVVAEALAHRCPVLISRRVNIWREVDEAGAGLVEDDTVAGTTRLLERFLALAPAERAAIGQAGFALYRARFTAEAAARDLEDVLASLAADRAA